MFVNHKHLVYYVLLGYFIQSYSAQNSSIIDECAKWNASQEVVIFGDFNQTNGSNDFALSLANSSGLDINRQTGEIAVLDDNNHRVFIFNRSNTSVLSMIVSISSNASNPSSILNSPSAITYDRNYSLYVLDLYQSEKQIIRLDQAFMYGVNATTNFKLNFTSPPFVDETLGRLAVDDRNGPIFISSPTHNQIIYYNQSNGNYISSYYGNGTAGNGSSQLRYPLSLVLGINRTLYVNDLKNNRIQMFQPNNKTGTTLPINITSCLGLSFHPSNVLVLNTNNHVYLFNLTNSQTRCILGCDGSNNNFTDIHKSIIDNDGSLIITNSNKILSFPSYQECPPTSTTSTTTTTTTATTTSTTSATSTTATTPVPSVFTPNQNCPPGTFGLNCSSSNDICTVSQPCRNDGTCNTTESGYRCNCQWGFSGLQCEIDSRPCQFFTCFQRGECINKSLTDYYCRCGGGYTGPRCQTVIDFCANVTCQNRAICTHKDMNYTCNCLAGYSGRYCEIAETATIVRVYVRKSCGYIAILMLGLIIGFIVFMDVLKYGFGIDPIQQDRNALKKRKRLLDNRKKRRNMQKQQQQRPKIGYRFQYVN